MEEPKIIAITGPNGSGKTLYVEKMRREMASDSVRYVAFCDSYGQQTDRAYYLQQRWNQHDIDNETPTVAQALQRSYNMSGADTPERRDWLQRLYTTLGLKDSMEKLVISLSSGELRKMQLVKALLTKPKTLIIDNPFIGLDEAARQQLKALLLLLATDEHITIYIVVARPSDIPDYVSEKLEMRNEKHDYAGGGAAANKTNPISHSAPLTSHSGRPVVEMRDVGISYGGRTILSNINWTINQGEHWALTGPNGSGKSTLLSLISADNPQGYACDISLFGRRRGTGETIWDIKRRIGYVSPEMHRSYKHNIPALQIVASGLKDTVGLYTRPNEEEKELCRQWLSIFGLKGKEEQPFLTLSSGEQRLVLLARAFVKSPDLLILDEPMHGLDDRNRQMVKDIIADYCSHPTNTLIMVSHYEDELPECIDHRKSLSSLSPQ